MNELREFSNILILVYHLILNLYIRISFKLLFNRILSNDFHNGQQLQLKSRDLASIAGTSHREESEQLHYLNDLFSELRFEQNNKCLAKSLSHVFQFLAHTTCLFPWLFSGRSEGYHPLFTFPGPKRLSIQRHLVSIKCTPAKEKTCKQGFQFLP